MDAPELPPEHPTRHTPAVSYQFGVTQPAPNRLTIEAHARTLTPQSAAGAGRTGACSARREPPHHTIRIDDHQSGSPVATKRATATGETGHPQPGSGGSGGMRQRMEIFGDRCGANLTRFSSACLHHPRIGAIRQGNRALARGGAGGGIRTRTPFRTMHFECIASTSCATPARPGSLEPRRGEVFSATEPAATGPSIDSVWGGPRRNSSPSQTSCSR